MGQFKPMVKMMTTEPTVELKLKKGGAVKKADGGAMMAALPSTRPTGAIGTPRGGMAMAARPAKPAMAARRAAMAGRPMMKEGGKADAMEALKAHADKPASKAHKGLATGGVAKSPKPGNYATGGVVNGQGGYKKGGAIAKSGIINTENQGGEYRNTKMHTAKVDTNSAPTGEVKLGNAGGYKKGGSAKKAYATGGAVNDSGRAVAYPKKPVSNPVKNNLQSGTFKKGGSVTPAEKKLQSNFKAENATAMRQAKAMTNLKYGRKMAGGGGSGAVSDKERRMLESSSGSGLVSDKERRMQEKAYNESIGPSKEDMEMANAIRDIPGKLFRGAKDLLGFDKAPKGGSVTETQKSVTVTPAKKRGGSVKC